MLARRFPNVLGRNATLDDWLDACADNPDDDQLRLVFADWLEEQGEIDRAEYIRLGLSEPPEGSAHREWQRRATQLLESNRIKWLGPLAKLLPADEWIFHRGLPEELDLSSRIKSPLFSRVLSSPLVSRLTRLSVTMAEYKMVAGRVLKSIANLPRLRYLDLNGNGFGDQAIVAFKRHCFPPKLKWLRLSWNNITAVGAAAIADCDNFSQLKYLDLAFNQIEDAGIATIANSRLLLGLSGLSLRRNQITSEGVKQLTASGQPLHISNLDLAENEIDDIGVMGLAASSQFARLTSLDLGYNRLTKSSAEAFANSQHLGNLDALQLDVNEIGDGGVVAFAQSPVLGNLRVLSLLHNGVGDSGACTLSEAPLRRVELVNLASNQIGDVGATALAKATYSPHIKALCLQKNKIGKGIRQLLKTVYGDRVDFRFQRK